MTYILILLLLITQIGDYFTTIHLIKHGNREFSPLLHWIFNYIPNKKVVMLTKSVGVTLIGILISLISTSFLIAVTVVYAGIVSWNIYECYKK